jgi:hypothetical protein
VKVHQGANNVQLQPIGLVMGRSFPNSSTAGVLEAGLEGSQIKRLKLENEDKIEQRLALCKSSFAMTAHSNARARRGPGVRGGVDDQWQLIEAEHLPWHHQGKLSRWY